VTEGGNRCEELVASAAPIRHTGTVLAESRTRVEFGVVPWRIDSAAGRDWLGGHDGKLCDAVVAYADTEGRRRLVVVELKASGAKLDEGLKQISETLDALRRPLAGCTVEVGAVVAFHGNAPRSRSLVASVKAFKRENRGLEPQTGGRVDPRSAPTVSWTFRPR
jgi:hypothetical protein